MSTLFHFLVKHFPALLHTSLTAGIVIVFVILVRFMLKRAPKIFSYALWAIVLLRLLVPVSVKSPVSIVPEPVEVSQIQEVNNILPEFSYETAQDRTDNTQRQEMASPDVPPAQVTNTIDPMTYLTLIWLAGVAVMLIRSALSYWRTRRKVRVSVPFRKGIMVADDIGSPFVMGFFRPVIYLPGSLDRSARKYIIAHERHHIHRGDHIFKALGFLALTVHWFNPLVWVAFDLAGRDMEMSCDEAVVRRYSEDIRADYSASLLDLASGRRIFSMTPLAFGESDPTGRVRNLSKWRKPSFWAIIICMIICSVLAVCLLTSPQKTADIMTLQDFNRTMAHVGFRYPDDAATYQISEEYTVEVRKNGNWQELDSLAGKPTVDEIIVTPEDPDCDAQSILMWEDIYGCLPDGSYRIRMDITKITDGGDTATTPMYIRFSIGGTADEYITYSLEDITPAGADLYEHETVDDSVVLVYSQEGFWLETLQDGQWVYLEPTEDVGSSLQQRKHYIHELVFPSSHTELIWSHLYGDLPAGTYRIAREITNTDPSVLRLCTVYEEFTISETASEGSSGPNDWGVALKPDRVSRTGATALFVYGGTVPGEEGAELTYGDLLTLDRLENGAWVPVEELPGYSYFVGDSSYPVVDGYGMVHEWPNRFGELPDGHYRMGKLVTLTRPDGPTEERMVYGEFTLPESIRTGLIPMEELPEHYSSEQAMIDGCFVSEDGHARNNQELFREFANDTWNGIPSVIRLYNCHYADTFQWSVMDLQYDGNVYTLTCQPDEEGQHTYTFRYLKRFTGEKAWEGADHDAFEYYILVNDDSVTFEDIMTGKLDMSDWKEPAHWTVFAEFTYLPDRPQLPEGPAKAELEFEGKILIATVVPDRLEKIWFLFQEAEYLGYEPKTHSVGVGLHLILTAKNGETVTIELDPDSDICRIDGNFVFYGAFDEPDYIEKLWYYLGISAWPDDVYEKYPNAYRSLP